MAVLETHAQATILTVPRRPGMWTQPIGFGQASSGERDYQDPAAGALQAVQSVTVVSFTSECL